MSSWFSDLTDKAGAFLNNLDQVAANSLQEAGIGSPSSKPYKPPSNTDKNNDPISFSPSTTQQEKAPTVAQVLVGSASESPHLAPTNRISRIGGFVISSPSSQRNVQSNTTSKVSDDSLFQFLNSPQTSSSTSRKRSEQVSPPPSVLTPPVTKTSMPRPNSSPALNQSDKRKPAISERSESAKPKMEEEDAMETIDLTVGDVKQVEEGEAAVLLIEDTSAGTDEVDLNEAGGQGRNSSEMDDMSQSLMENRHMSPHGTSPAVVVAETATVEATAELEKWKKSVSNLELENKLMKREVASLNEELGGVMARLNESSQSTAHYQSEIHALREQASQSDQLIRQLRSRGDDLEAAVQVRDTQLQAQQLELSGAIKQVEELKNHLLFARKEQDRLVQDASLSSGAHSQALDSVKGQLSQVEAQLVSSREEHLKEKTLLMERESLLQAEKVQLSNDLAAVERQVAAEQGRVRDYQATLQSLQREMQILKKEHEDYKQRAASILQAKEKLIQSLQGGGGGVGERNRVEDARVEEMKLEKEQLQAQINSTFKQLEDVKKELQELEERSSVELESALEQVRVCEGVLEGERQQRLGAQEDVARQAQEMQMLREDLDRERSCHRENVQAKEKVINELKLQMATSMTPGKAELEVQLRQMTDSLIEKQTSLEALNSEKSSLNVQIKRLQEELKQSKRMKPPVANETVVHMNRLEQSEGHQVPAMTSVIPPLHRAPENSRLNNVRQAVNSVDRFSIRLGVFLRRYPQARLFTILYVVLLHLWVIFVLLTYSPETHSSKPEA